LSGGFVWSVVMPCLVLFYYFPVFFLIPNFCFIHVLVGKRRTAFSYR